MRSLTDHPASGRTSWRGLTALAVLLALAGTLGVLPSPAQAATSAVDLGTAESFAVLAGSAITNTGPTTITGDVGSFPGPAQSGFASVTLTGTNHTDDAVSQQAKDDLVTAYDEAAGHGPPTEIPVELGGTTLAPGVYDSAPGTFENTGVLVLDGENQTNPVFVFQAGSSLTTATASSVVLINGADACNVYWQVGSSATLGTSSHLVGTILAQTSITLTTGATLDGRALARNGAVTLDTNTIEMAACEPVDTEVTLESSNPVAIVGESITLTATVTADDATTPSGTVEFFDGDTSIGTAPVGDDGVAELVTADLGEGTHTITATYLGAPGHEPSTSGDLTQTVRSPAAPDTPAPGTPIAPGLPNTPGAPAAPSAPVAPDAPAPSVPPAAPSAPITPGSPRYAG